MSRFDRLRSGKVWPFLQVAFAIALLAFLWRAADGRAALDNLAAANWSWLALAFVALSFQTVLSALRWQLTARQLGIRLGTGHAIREYYIAQVVNQSLPGGMVGDASRALRARAQAGLLASGQAVVFERLAGQIAMFVTLTIAFCVTLAVPGGLEWPRSLAVPVAALIAAGVAMPPVAWAATRLPGVVGKAASRVRSLIGLALLSRAALPGQIGLSICTTICNLAAFAFCARAVGLDLGAGAITGLVPLILFTMLIPISISGWGLREGAAAALLPLAGATASGAFAASVAFGLTFIVAVLPGIMMMWISQRTAGFKSGQV